MKELAKMLTEQLSDKEKDNDHYEFAGPDEGTRMRAYLKGSTALAMVLLDRDGRPHSVGPNPATERKRCYYVEFRNGRPNYTPLDCADPDVNLVIYD